MNRLQTIALAAALAAAAPAAAQHGTTPPAPGPLRPYQVPTPQEFTLPNGLRVVVVRQNALPIVNGRLIVKAGASYEPAGKAGVAQLTALLLREGTQGMTGSEIAARMERLGAQFSTSGGYASAAANVTALKPQFSQALALAARTVMQPTFPESDFARVRTQAIAGYVANQSSAEGLADETFNRALFQPGAPFARPPGGTRATLETLTLQDVRDWHRRTYAPSNAILLLVGDVTTAEARQWAQQALGAWSGAAVSLTPAANPAQAAQGTRIILVDRPGSVQSGVVIGQATVGFADPSYYAYSALSQVLGGGFRSRLNSSLRERHGWTYGSFSLFNPRDRAGLFEATASVRTNATDSAVAELVRQYRSIATEPVPAQELREGLANLVGSFPNTVQTVQGLSQRMESLILFGMPLNFWSSYRERIAAVTPEDVARVGREKLTPDAVTVVVVGDLSKIEAPIRALNLGTVEVLDAAGNKVR
jgi:zinc protease